jgi:hypothetical protein
VRYWQIAAGSESRDYSRDFLKYGLAFVGGAKNEQRMAHVSEGDRLILKRGKSEILAVGVVVKRDGVFQGTAPDSGAREWMHDYDGWDLPAFCCVEWHREPAPRPVTGLTIGAIKKVAPHQTQLRAIADDILRTAPTCPVEQEPQPTPPLSVEEMLDLLIRLGLRPANALELTGTLEKVRLLARYYYNHCSWADVREHEARAFLIIPFLIALGWSEQQIKIELGVKKARRGGTGGGRLDIACFRRPYRRDPETGQPNNTDCVLILESKGFSQGLDYAHGQGKEYAAQFPNSEVVVASNGYCYKAYSRRTDGTGFEDTPTAYLNLLRPRKNYPLDPGKKNGGLELLFYLMPQRG